MSSSTSPSSLIDSAVRFIEYVGTFQESIHKKELRRIYNGFKEREASCRHNFYKVLNALERCNRVIVRKDIVYIVYRAQPRDYYDQGWRPRAPRRKRPSCGPEEPAAPSPGPSTAVAPALKTKTVLASRVQKELLVNWKTLLADKKGIEITSDPESSDGKVECITEALGEYVVRFHIKNKGPASVHFTSYAPLSRIRWFTLEDERRMTRACPVFLSPGESYEVVARYELQDHGYFSGMIYFEFLPDESESKPFSIMREMVAASRTPLAAELGPVAPYKPLRLCAKNLGAARVVEGKLPERDTRGVPLFRPAAKTSIKLEEYRYPHDLKTLVKANLEDSKVKSLLTDPLNMTNYHQRFSLLLHLEEIQMEVDIRKHELYNQTVTQDISDRNLLTLKVPGVAWKYPSVIPGDCLRLFKSGDTSKPLTVYEGYVQKVKLDTVKLRFSKKVLESLDISVKFDVEFTASRYILKLQHRAVHLAAKYNLKDVLFPSGAAVTGPSLPILSLFNSDLDKNPEQRAAVQHIVAGSSKPAPYLVFGPPGTGKTSTLVEAMYQVVQADPLAHILACAPSNSACDFLWERLMKPMGQDQVYRMYANSRDPMSVPQDHLGFCNWDEKKKEFGYPGNKSLMDFKIIVTTIYTAGKFVTRGIPMGHFTHVFVDEASQASEPQCVIAVAGLLSATKGQLVLAGDPMQLGPIIQSRHASQLKLSLLERLMSDNDLYKTRKDPRFFTKLLRNYRCHAAILKIPNELFYDNEVQDFSDQRGWELLPEKIRDRKNGFPVIFHTVFGKDEREANSPSFFNTSEICYLVTYVTKLMKTRGTDGIPKFTGKHIGIIAPYRKQVEKIQKALKNDKALCQWSEVKDIKVGSVEDFQGEERRIIIISTVRGSDCTMMDRHALGFLSNPKRFNVAVTRASSLLIVVGNPVVLNKDHNWKKFISYCEEEHGCEGFPLKDIMSEEDVAFTLEQMKIGEDSRRPVEEERLLQ